MRRPTLLLACLALVACGDNLAGDAFAPQSGARLKLGWYVYTDGARQVSPFGLTDVELATPCTVQRWSDGAAYCTPPAGFEVFTDAACTQPIFAVAREGITVDYLITTFTLDGVTSPSRLYRRGAALPPPAAVYARIAGQCTAADPGGYAFHERGAEVPRTALARVKRSEPRGSGRLRVALETSDDGLRLPAAIVDAELGAACVVEGGRSDAPTARCVPTASGVVVFFRDEACTVPVLSAPRGAAPPVTAMTVDDATGCTSYAPIATELAAPALYRFVGASCMPASAPADHRVFALGPPLELGVVERVPRPGDGHRLWNVDAVHADARLPLDVMLDLTVDTECERVPGNGGVACVPWSQGAEPRIYYGDPGCSFPIEIALVPSGACDPRSRFVRYPYGSDTIVRQLGEPYRGTLYEISTADSCIAYLPPPRLVAHELGPYLALDAFASATLVVDP